MAKYTSKVKSCTQKVSFIVFPSFISFKTNIFASELNKLVMKNLNRIKAVLAEKNRTGKWLAEQLEVNTATVSKWCSNTCQPNLYTLNDIAKLLDVDVKDLINSEK